MFEPVLHSEIASILAIPGASAVTSPELETDTTPAGELCHVTTNPSGAGRRPGPTAYQIVNRMRNPMTSTLSLMILVAGPYRSGTGDDPEKLAANVRAMEAYALPLFRAGHIPLVGEWLALPLVALAGSRQIGDAPFEEIFHPIAERLLARCDAVLRMGGASRGADLMVETARQHGLAVYHDLREVPGCREAALPSS